MKKAAHGLAMGCKDIKRCLFSVRVRPSASHRSAWEPDAIAAQAGILYVAVPRVWIPYAAAQPDGIQCAESAQAGIPDEPE
jgi:hypothetical protein